jgi:hypothetical protein
MWNHYEIKDGILCCQFPFFCLQISLISSVHEKINEIRGQKKFVDKATFWTHPATRQTDFFPE